MQKALDLYYVNKAHSFVIELPDGMCTVSTDELLCDSVICCKPVYEKEILETTADCDDYEIRILSYILKAAKMALRENGDLRRLP